MRTSEKVDKVLPALLKVKANLQAVSKDTNNPFFKSKYADLNAYLDAVEALLNENGLILFQPVVETTGTNVVTSRIYEAASGQFVESSMKLIGDNDMQKAGSGVTYARRYTLGSLLAMKAEDDDGNSSVGKTKAAAPAAKRVVAAIATNVEKAEAKTEAPTAAPVAANARPSFKRPDKAAVAAPAPVSTETTSNDDDGL